ncbi:hypothetical protein JRO89_XS01G0217300 [Xanthoceras sorbifolium]|uniref:Uncharacterized protein n=1 Tax=Xanthoceras sorbifolium TaxID=99658 RepID=A0ABQ8IL09_9ROSI|nr:hypothetical protein JRO89_XS01G0217300 [Xanthoceras sorbifolium]
MKKSRVRNSRPERENMPRRAALRVVAIKSLFTLSLSLSLPFNYCLHLSSHIRENGGLGAGNNSNCAVCVADAGAAVPAARQGQSGGVCKHANQWRLHLCSHHHLLWPRHHFPHCYWCSYLHWIIFTPD